MARMTTHSVEEHPMSDPSLRCAGAGSTPQHRAPGRVHVYTGEGKGKTSAAMGLALRALGHRRRVFIGQFMKTGSSGEVAALGAFGLARVEGYGHDGWLFGEPTSEHQRRARAGFARSIDALTGGRYDIVILDEIDVALSFGLLTIDDCLLLLDRRPHEVELVFTGRSAPPEITARADLVTEMREVKHYYHQGVDARPGIEY